MKKMGNSIQTIDEIRDLSSKIENKACELANKLVRIQDWIDYSKKEQYDKDSGQMLLQKEVNIRIIQAIGKIINS